jgi:pyridoxamine 5'-phosphate oxidase-like protein
MVSKKKPTAKADPKAGRPHMPGYGVPTSRRGLLPWKWAEQRLKRSHNYWLITTRPNGSPHAMPVWGVFVDSKFCFSPGRAYRKARNLAANPRCVICNERAEQAVIVEGIAEEVADPTRIKELGIPYHRKCKPWQLDPKLGPVFIVRPRRIFGMYEKKVANAATKWTFEQ